LQGESSGFSQICFGTRRALNRSGRRHTDLWADNWQARKTPRSPAGNDRPCYLHIFCDAIEAARACDRKAVEFLGESTRLNVAEE